MTAITPLRRCAICEEGVLHSALHLSPSTQIVECTLCKVAALEPMPSPKELAAAYPDDSYYSYVELGNESKNVSTPERIRNRLREAAYSGRINRNGSSRFPDPFIAWLLQGRFSGFPLRKEPGHLLDVGCGDGYFLSFCQRAGWKVTGVEQSKKAAERAQKAGLDVRGGDFLSLDLPEKSFDVIRLWHVLEHVQDPRMALQKVRMLLAPGGELVLGVPNAHGLHRKLFGPRWTGWDWPRHLFHFSPAGLRKLLESEKFKIQRLEHRSVGTGLASLGPKASQSVALRGASWVSDTVLDLLHMGDSLEVHAQVVKLS